MIIKWIRERQYTNWGLINQGDIVNTVKRGIPKETALKWIDGEFAVEVKPKKSEVKK